MIKSSKKESNALLVQELQLLQLPENFNKN